VLALLTLLFASAPSTRSLGLQAATGLVVAALFALVVLPPLLALCGVRLFWPFIPKSADDAAGDPVVTGFWHRIATAVAARPVWVAATSIGLLAVLATGLLATPTGLSQTEQFRVRAESVSGYDAVAAHFPVACPIPRG
jgi:RND superfamily putative drug exporter